MNHDSFSKPIGEFIVDNPLNPRDSRPNGIHIMKSPDEIVSYEEFTMLFSGQRIWFQTSGSIYGGCMCVLASGMQFADAVEDVTKCKAKLPYNPSFVLDCILCAVIQIGLLLWIWYFDCRQTFFDDNGFCNDASALQSLAIIFFGLNLIGPTQDMLQNFSLV